MSVEISSNDFFNFTKNINYLKETLEHKAFSPRYNREYYDYLNISTEIRKIYILMKCFCDIPLGPLMKKHIKNYGAYGIGLEKAWGLKNNLTPIHYIPVLSKKEWYKNNLSSLYRLTLNKKSDPELKQIIINYFMFIKPYKYCGRVFYDEREWRYIPSLDNIKKINTYEDLRIKSHLIIPDKEQNKILSDNLSNDLIKESNKLINNEHLCLRFDYKDIKYVIVKAEEERDQIKKLLEGNSNIEIKTLEDIELQP